MFSEIIILIQSWMATYGFLGVFGASLIEELISVIPSSIVQGSAGALLFAGVPFSITTFFEFLWKVSVASALGVSIGSVPYVWASRFFGLRIIDRFGSWIGVTVDDVKKLEERLNKSRFDDILFTLLRAVPLFPSVAFAIYGGIVEMPILKYMTLSFIGVFIRATVLGLIGWLFGSVLADVSQGVDWLEKTGFIILIICAIAWWLINKKQKKNQKK